MRVVAPDLPGRGRSELARALARLRHAAYLAAMAALIARLDVDAGRLGRHVARRPHRHGVRGATQASPIRRLVLNDFGARIAASPRCSASARYLRRAHRRFASVDEVEAHLREILAPFGNLTDAQWRHLAEHGAVPTDDGRLPPALRPGDREQFSRPIMLDIVLWQRVGHGRVPDADPARRALGPAVAADRRRR